MHRFLGLLAGAATSLITGYVRAKRKRLRQQRPRLRLGICDHQCRREYHSQWKHLPDHDPRSSEFLSYLERAWFEDLEPSEATDSSPAVMERALFGHASLLLDELVERKELEPHEAEHLKDYYRAMIFRTAIQQ